MTEQRKKFCREFIKNKFNGTNAAIAAGYAVKSARCKASQILASEEAQEYLATLQEELKEEFNINAKELVDEFRSISDTNIADIFEIDSGGAITLKTGVVKLSDLPREITKNIKSIKNTANGIAIEMYCRDAALRDLAKIAGLYSETINLNDVRQPDLSGLTIQELKNLAKAN